MISLIIFGSDILATPPCALISAGTRSSAITATAPASSAIRAYGEASQMQGNRDKQGGQTCSALTTSIMTPPCNIRARPALTAKLESLMPLCAALLALSLLMGSSVAILLVLSLIICSAAVEYDSGNSRDKERKMKRKELYSYISEGGMYDSTMSRSAQ